MAKNDKPVQADMQAAPPAAFPMTLDEFVRTYEPRREVETKAGFRVYAPTQGWLTPVPFTEWLTRYEAFRNRPLA
jgi:hypothetical protein